MVRTAGVFAVLLGAFIIGTWPILEKIGQRWLKFDEAYSHGLMILAVSLYLIYQSCRARPLTTSFFPAWLIPLGLFITLYVVAALLYIEAVQQLLLLPILFMSIATVSGFATVWRLLLPIGILFFALPLWDYAAWPLQLITTAINEVLLGIWGIEFEIEGVLVFLPGIGAFEIAHGCSGLRYLLVAMSLATVYSEMNYRLWRNRILLFSVAVALALLTNWIRVFVIIYMGYVTDMETTLIRDHEFFGWILFAAALVPLFIFAGRLERDSSGTVAHDDESARAAVGSPPRNRAALATVVVAIFLVIPFSVYAVRQSDKVTQQFSISLEGAANWSPLFQRISGLWEPDYAGADHHSRKAWFQNPEQEAAQMPLAYSAAHVLTYETQAPGKELISDQNRIVDTAVWNPQGTFTTQINGETVAGLRLIERQTGDAAVVIYGFYVSGNWASEPFGAKLLQLYGALNSRKDASLIAVSVRCSDCDLENQAKAWAEQVMPQAQQALDERFEDARG